MIKLGTEGKKFSFKVSQDKLSGSLSNIKNLAGSDGSFFLVAADKELWALATSSSFIGALKVEAEEVSGDGQFGFNMDLLQGVTKGRAALSFNFTGSECEFKALKSKYNGKIITIPVTKEQSSTVNEAFAEKAKGIKLTSDVLVAISNGITSTSLVNMATKEKCNSLINLNKGKLVVSSFDDYHMMMFSAKVKSDEAIKFSINPQTMSVIEKAISGKFELSVKKETIRFSNKNFVIIVPTVQAEDDKYEIAPGFIKSLGKEIFKATVDTKTLQDTCVNLDTIHTANSEFEIELADKGFSVKFVTENGSASDKIGAEGVSGKGSRSMNPKAFMDMLNCTKQHGAKVVDISVHETVCAVTSVKNKAKLSGVCVLSQEGTGAKDKKKKKGKEADKKNEEKSDGKDKSGRKHTRIKGY